MQEEEEQEGEEVAAPAVIEEAPLMSDADMMKLMKVHCIAQTHCFLHCCLAAF